MKWQRICFILFAVLMVGAFAVGIRLSYGTEDHSGSVIPFDDGWRGEDGIIRNLSELPRMQEGESIVLTRISPDMNSAEDVWNLASHNIYFQVLVGDYVVYSFQPEENITGRGYGDYVHRITIRPAGATVKLVCSPVYPGENSAFFRESYVGPASEFNTIIFKKYGLSFAISILTIILGLLVLILHFSSFGVKDSRYYLPALAVSVLLVGVWTSVSTLIPQLFIQDQVILRVLDYGCLAFFGYPLVVFVNSVTEQRRRIYEIISLIITVACASCLIGLRVLFGVDMHKVNQFNLISVASALVLILIIFIDDFTDNRKHRHAYVNRALHFGGTVFVICGTIDLFIYFFRHKSVVNEGVFTQFGFLIFIMLMVVQWQRRVMIEHRMVDHQRFINRLLQYSYSGQSADVIIHQMLEYLCEETGAARAFIYEEERRRQYKNTYEYVSTEDNAVSDKIQSIPREGLIAEWFNEFRDPGYVEISDLGYIKQSDPYMYEVLKGRGIETLLACPLEREGGIIGFFVLSNPPQARMKEIVSILRLLAFFIVMALRQRDNQMQLIRYSYVDHLTGVRNRRSLDEMREKVQNEQVKYGMMMCDINGLKKMNDVEGHEAGDAMICDVAECLKQTYGDRRVFRMGGDEFLVVREGGTREQFENSAREVKEMIFDKNRSVAVGVAFSDEGDGFESVMRLADERMYTDKKKYYENSGEDRRRR